jgi:hypothetical protein
LKFRFRETRAGDRAPGWLRFVALLSAAILALASGRALAPGLCPNAEAAAVVATQHDGTAIQPLRNCCASLLSKRAAPEAPADTPSPAPPKKNCALCALAAARFEPLVHAATPLPAEPVALPAPPAPVAPTTLLAPLPHQGRAPPAVSLA